MVGKLLGNGFYRLSAAFRALNAKRGFRLLFPAALGVLVAGPLVFVIFFTALDWQWVAFLSGILFSAFLALASRASRAEWRSLRRSSQLAHVKDHLSQESAKRRALEAELKQAEEKLALFDTGLPAMLAYVDAERCCQYHNQAFGDWVDLPAARIDGRPMSEVLSKKVYAEIKEAVSRALAGEWLQRERTHASAEGRVFRYSETYIPRFGEGGKVEGCYLLSVDVTGREDLDAGEQLSLKERETSAAENPDALYADAVAEEFAHWKNPAEYVTRALETNQFAVYGQEIRRVRPDAQAQPMFELLVRLREEEESMLPPGAFLPVLEHYNLMPALDRWVVRHVLDLYGRRRATPGWVFPLCAVNLSSASLADPEFTGWVRQELLSRQLPPHSLCFEIDQADAARVFEDTRRLVEAMQKLGCPIALSGFGHSTPSFNVLKHLPVQFIKIEGNLVVNITRDPVAMAKVGAINRVSHVIGVKTVAEFVETQEILEKLRETGVDYAQGFLFSRPQPIETLI